MAESFDPYYRWLGIPPKHQPPNLYRLLGLELFEANVEVIRDAAEQRMAHVRTYQLGRHSELSQKILNELAAAKARLMDPADKAAYDAELQSALPAGSDGDSVAPFHPWKMAALVASAVLAPAAIVLLVIWNAPSREGTRVAESSGPRAAEEAALPTGASPAAGGAKPFGKAGSEPRGSPPYAVAPFDADKAKEHQAVWAKHLGLPVESANSLGMKLILIPPGEFMMGSAELDRGPRDQKPQHRVQITKPFLFGVHEVTVGQFRSFAHATGYQTEAEQPPRGALRFAAEGKRKMTRQADCNWRNPGFEQTDDHPVVAVSWNDATKFCEWLSAKEGQKYRLPTEAEWEYAARAGTQTRFANGDDVRVTEIGNHADASLKGLFVNLKRAVWSSDGYAYTSPVGKYLPNAFGAYDMVGNVREWCADWYSATYYAQSPEADPAGPPSGERRAARGSSWCQPPAPVTDRYPASANFRSNAAGFRVVREVGESARAGK